MLTPEQIKQLRAGVGIPEQGIGSSITQPPAEQRIAELRGQTQAPKELGFWGGVNKNLGDFATGVAKGELQTVQGLGQLVLKGTDLMGITKNKGGSTFFQDPKALEPINTAETIGKTGEQIAEFFIPAAKAAKAEKAINLISQGIKTPLLATGARILGKSAVQGVAGGAVSLAQTGGDVKEAKKVALTAGATRGAMAVIGEGARALHIPERLYSTIFKNSAKDMLSELKSGGLVALQKNNPEKFNSLIKEGIIKVDKLGNATVNDTLAEQALDKGLRGSFRDMSNEVVEKTLDSELKVRQIAKNYKGTVNLKEPQIKNVLLKIAQEYDDVGFGEISNDAKNLANQITSGKGNVSATVALEIRRLLDSARIASSFERPATSLSLTQANLKTLADAVRGRLNSIPEMGSVMKDYSFYIDAMESIAKEAARRGNNQVLSLIDSLFLSSAFQGATQGGQTGTPNLLLYLLRRTLVAAPTVTRMGQAIKNSTVSPLTSGLISAGSSGVQSDQTNQ